MTVLLQSKSHTSNFYGSTFNFADPLCSPRLPEQFYGWIWPFSFTQEFCISTLLPNFCISTLQSSFPTIQLWQINFTVPHCYFGSPSRQINITNYSKLIQFTKSFQCSNNRLATKLLTVNNVNVIGIKASRTKMFRGNLFPQQNWSYRAWSWYNNLQDIAQHMLQWLFQKAWQLVFNFFGFVCFLSHQTISLAFVYGSRQHEWKRM